MKRHLISIISLSAIILIISGCNAKQPEIQKVDLPISNNFIVIADTIINDVVIKNPDNDEWIDFSLRNLDKKSFVDNIFKSVYNGDLTPFEFFNNTPLTTEDIKALEKNPEFNRDLIAKVQFEEAWYYDPDNQQMTKKVISVMLAYEIYSESGEIKGYKPAFKVYFK